MTTVSLQLSSEDVDRIAVAVTARLQVSAPKRWFDVEAASEYTSLSKEAIRTAAKRGRLQGHKGASGRLVFTIDELDSYMRSPA